MSLLGLFMGILRVKELRAKAELGRGAAPGWCRVGVHRDAPSPAAGMPKHNAWDGTRRVRHRVCLHCSTEDRHLNPSFPSVPHPSSTEICAFPVFVFFFPQTKPRGLAAGSDTHSTRVAKPFFLTLCAAADI